MDPGTKDLRGQDPHIPSIGPRASEGMCQTVNLGMEELTGTIPPSLQEGREKGGVLAQTRPFIGAGDCLSSRP